MTEQTKAPTSQFFVATDGGLDAYKSIYNDVPVAPFSVTFGSETFTMDEISREELIRRVQSDGPHPTTSQPTPHAWAEAIARARIEQAETPATRLRPVLAVTISGNLSGSKNAAEQAIRLINGDVRIVDCGSLSTAQSFVVHALETARRRGESLETALEWATAVREETELFFTVDTLNYLQKGGRIGKVAATLGGLLNIRPVITVEKPEGIYNTAARSRGYKGAIREIAKLLTQRFGEGTPLRVGFLGGSHDEDTELLRAEVATRHPLIWEEVLPVNPSLMVHTGPRAVGLAAAAGPWPWER